MGAIERLPNDGDSFDLLTAFNSSFFAADIVPSLREAARRVAKPGAPVLIEVWGRPERCDLGAQKQVARRYAPRQSAGSSCVKNASASATACSNAPGSPCSSGSR